MSGLSLCVFQFEVIYAKTQVSNVAATAMPIGSSFGSLIGGYQSGFLGRKKSLTVGNLAMAAGFGIIGFGTNFALLMVGRTLTGIAYGMMMVDVPLYCAEIAQPTIRPLALTM